MTARWVGRPCDPYPSPHNTDRPGSADYRRSQYLTEVLDRLEPHEIRDIARTLGNLYPRSFEQELLWIQQGRNLRATRDA